MVLIRSLIYFSLLVLTIVLFGVVAGILGLLGFNRSADYISTKWGASNGVLLHWVCGLKVNIQGAEHLSNDAAIIMSKHQSAWETIYLRGFFRPEQSWILKQELMRIPIFGWALKAAKSIPIDRSAGREAIKVLTEKGIEYLNEGRNVIIFPEGTRTPPGSRQKYNIGGGILANKSGYPVIPIAHNAGVFWRRNDIRKYPGTIQVVIGPAIETKGKKSSQIMKEVEDWIETQQENLPLER